MCDVEQICFIQWWEPDIKQLQGTGASPLLYLHEMLLLLHLHELLLLSLHHLLSLLGAEVNNLVLLLLGHALHHLLLGSKSLASHTHGAHAAHALLAHDLLNLLGRKVDNLHLL